jgi:small multidrug resistance pump
MHYLYLAVAIVSEVIGTTALQASNGFSRPLPSLIVVVGYGIAFYGLSIAIKTIPVGLAYAIWSGVGIVLISAIGVIWLRQHLDLAAVLGLALIIAGVIVVNLFSRSMPH